MRRPPHRNAVATIGAASAFVALLTWTAAVIYYIDTTYKPNMGFWAVILIALALLSSIPLCTIVFKLSALASHRVMIVPYLISLLFLVAILSLSIPLLEWTSSGEPSLMRTYASFLGLMLAPPLLIGFITSGVASWIDSMLLQTGGEPSVATETSEACCLGWPGLLVGFL
ncbi:MAG: hypothetical protein AAF664_22025 [Planctomycetota bacterium]